MELRPYQRNAVDAIYDYYRKKNGHCLIILPTGSGKSLVQASFIKETLAKWDDQRILCLTHSKELIQQNYDEMRQIWPMAPIGIYSAGIGRRETDANVIFAGIASVYKKADKLGAFSLIIVDECHLIPHDDDGMYRALFKDMHAMNPRIRVIGLTATPFRLGHGRLIDGGLFTDVAFEAHLSELVRDKYLAPLVSKAGVTKLDLNGVGTRGGEYIPGELSRAVDKDEVTSLAVDETIRRGQDRKSWLLFCCGVEHALHVRDKLIERGITAGCVTGETPKDERDGLLADFKSGKLRAITNNNVLTTGFNAPCVDLLVMLRPTKSVSLYVQMGGRGMRNAPGKENCLVLDFGGNTVRHGPIDAVEIEEKKKKGDGEAPARECPECQWIGHARIAVCPDCGYVFPVKEEPKHFTKPVDAPIMSSEVVPETLEVTDVTYQEWTKRGNPDAPKTMRVSYRCGLTYISEWVCVAHPSGSFAHRKASEWWRLRSDKPMPDLANCILHGLRRWLKEPSHVVVRKNVEKGWMEITRYVFPTPCNSCRFFDSGFCHQWEQDVPIDARGKGCSRHAEVEREQKADAEVPF